MADIARGTQIRETVAARLRGISTASGFRTNAGNDVRTEPSKLSDLVGMRLTVYPGSKVWPHDAASKTEREYAFVIEAAVSVSLETPAAECEAVEADCEDVLRDFLQQPLALPVQVTESVILDRPDGIAAMVLQIMCVTRYR